MSISFSPFISGHIVGVAALGWGHQKPLAALTSKIIQERPDILVTTLVLSDMVERTEKEVDRHLRDGSLKSNIRVITIGGQGSDIGENIDIMSENFEPFYKKLVHSEPVRCTSGKLYESAPRPTLAIIDWLLPEIAHVIREISGNDVSILAWSAVNASFCLRVLGPKKLGGYGDVTKQASQEAAATGKPISEIELELLRPNKGEVIILPGLPPMFDYEFRHRKSMKKFQQELVKNSRRSMEICDGIISASSIVYEKESLDAWRDWFAETNRRFYVVGPFLPSGIEQGALTQSTKSNDLSASVSGQDILSFLDKNMKESGKNSVLYISFGSAFWPNAEHVWILIDTLLELKYPFVLAHASPLAVIPPDVSLKVQASGIGVLSPWAPQQLILDHPATGWFLTHCGHNSVMEALGQGIPLIAWPIEADQPFNAARLSLVLDLGFELFETRVGFGLKPLYRGVEPSGTHEAIEHEIRTILHQARGEIGERKRKNAHAMRDAIHGTWSEDKGDALKQLRRLLSDYFP